MKRKHTYKLHKGITLIETIIVIAISTLLVFAALRINNGRGRREFDNSMKEFVAQLRATQASVQAGLGPDPSLNCKQKYTGDLLTNLTYYNSAANQDASGQPVCPYGSLFGIEQLFIRADDPDYASYGRTANMIDLRAAGSGPKAAVPAINGVRNYAQVKVSYSVYNFSGGSTTFPYGGIKDTNLPDNVAYLGSCAQSQITANTCTLEDTSAGSSFGKPANIIFAKAPYGTESGSSQGNIGQNYSNLVLTTFIKRCGFVNDYPASVDPNCNYSLSYLTNSSLDPIARDNLIMIFSDYSLKYRAKVTISAKSNEINLEFAD